jgi:type IV secretion system protein VirD4
MKKLKYILIALTIIGCLVVGISVIDALDKEARIKPNLEKDLKEQTAKLDQLDYQMKPYWQKCKVSTSGCSYNDVQKFDQLNSAIKDTQATIKDLKSQLNQPINAKINQNIVYLAVMAVLGIIAVGSPILIIWALFRRTTLPESDAHGTARFSSLDELKANNILRKNLETDAGDFIIGQSKQGFLVLEWKRTSRHVLIIGVNGSGKTFSIICPNIIGSTGESLFISDVKRQKGTTNGELWELTSGYRKKACYFSPLEPTKNMLKFNWIPALRGDVVTAKLFAEAVVFSSEGAKNAGASAFWYETARDLLAATWLHAAETDDPTPANAYHILMMKESELRKLLENSHVPAARLAARTYLDAPDKTSGSMLSTARNSFSFMQSPEIQHFTNTSNATDFSVLRREEVAIYYQARSEKKTLLQPLNCLILTYMFTQLKETDGLMVKFILDEFANFGKIPDFATEITLLRDKNLPIIAAVQTYRSQIESVYGRTETETILTNFNNKFCFAGLDEKSAEEVSRSLGEFTYVQEKISRSTSGLLDGTSTSRSIHEHGRRLMTADEVTRMTQDEILVFHASEMHPFKAYKIPYLAENKTMRIKEREIGEIKAPPRPQLPPMSAQDETNIPPMPEF